jgi:aspartate racemase
MKTLGLIGGMSWESTIPYYRIINEAVKERLGGLHSAKLVLHSVDFHEIEALQRAGDWDGAGRAMAAAAVSVAAAGADFMVLCTNTMHRVAPAMEQAAGIPLLHIADPTAAAIRARGLARVGLLGTRFTMEQDFYRGRLGSRHGLEVLVPPAAGREAVHRIIYEELCLGRFLEASTRILVAMIEALKTRGAEGAILGCTELPLVIKAGDLSVPSWDSLGLHAAAAVDFILGG